MDGRHIHNPWHPRTSPDKCHDTYDIVTMAHTADVAPSLLTVGVQIRGCQIDHKPASSPNPNLDPLSTLHVPPLPLPAIRHPAKTAATYKRAPLVPKHPSHASPPLYGHPHSTTKPEEKEGGGRKGRIEPRRIRHDHR